MVEQMRSAVIQNYMSEVSEIVYFDNNEYLREKTSDPSRLKEIIDDIEELLKICDEIEDRYFLYGTLGYLYRIYGQQQEAVMYLTLCISLALKEKNMKKELVSLLRLGEALKYSNKHEEALNIFNEVMIKCEDNNYIDYLDFALQHKGKCLMELDRLDESLKCLSEALRIRNLKGDSSLIKSTQQSLCLVKMLKDKKAQKNVYTIVL
jgi:HTH-type transcriptional regulator, pleiotropic regulator of extracellular virulence genes